MQLPYTRTRGRVRVDLTIRKLQKDAKCVIDPVTFATMMESTATTGCESVTDDQLTTTPVEVLQGGSESVTDFLAMAK
jgi:hypothetical protein